MCIELPLPTAIPSPPQNPSYTVQQYGQNSVTLTVQWQPPQYDGGAPVNYTITVSPGLSPVTTSGTSVPVTVPYDVTHAVSIVATNCNGSSSATMVTIRIGMCLVKVVGFLCVCMCTIYSTCSYQCTMETIHCKNIWVTSTIFWSSQLHACCVSETLAMNVIKGCLQFESKCS